MKDFVKERDAQDLSDLVLQVFLKADEKAIKLIHSNIEDFVELLKE